MAFVAFASSHARTFFAAFMQRQSHEVHYQRTSPTLRTVGNLRRRSLAGLACGFNGCLGSALHTRSGVIEAWRLLRCDGVVPQLLSATKITRDHRRAHKAVPRYGRRVKGSKGEWSMSKLGKHDRHIRLALFLVKLRHQAPSRDTRAFKNATSRLKRNRAPARSVDTYPFSANMQLYSFLSAIAMANIAASFPLLDSRSECFSVCCFFLFLPPVKG